jgi:D-beta-D-heptose 7-phosphate kinase/D-beta-D-heptose 1-phosphate adenosyltransferase
MILPALDPQRARHLLSHLHDHLILVVGDVMLDRFIVGRVTRISPEAPVPVVHFQSEFVRLGGAANVAHNLASLGARVMLVGVIGNDPAAARVTEKLTASGIGTAGLVTDPSRPTVEKVRIVTDRNQQVARIDYENDTDIAGSIEEAVCERIGTLGRNAAVLLVSDYLKGVVTRGAMGALTTVQRRGVPLLVDPKTPHLDRYAGATLVTPNHQEAEAATLQRIRSDDDARSAAAAFRARVQCDGVLITRGEHGMWLSSGAIEGMIPAVPREVADVTGAGDTVVATLAVTLAAGATIAEAAAIANQAASVVVGRFGPATVTPQEIAESAGLSV